MAATGYSYLWEFMVEPARQAEFERQYGPGGSWVGLFRQSPGYIGSELLKDRASPLRYVTIDHWASIEAWREFRTRFAESYEVLDRQCEELTVHEAALGEYGQAAPSAVPDARATGIGGIFFKSGDPKGLAAWYGRHLGLPVMHDNVATFEWQDAARPQVRGQTVWSAFPASTQYFSPGKAAFMINYRVVNLDRLLANLRVAGVTVDERVEEYDYGRFAWIIDPEGNRIELWEPTDVAPH